jgi:membrane protein YqaA with SNARE-associated domain
MAHIADWAETLALSLGGPGLFFVAFLDSSFLSLPEINDLLVIWMVIRHKERMVYDALMATLGSITGCFVLYYLGRKGGDVLLRKRFQGRRLDQAMALFGRYGVLAVIVPAILPPPAPFKIFVLLAGVAKVSPLQFAVAIGVGRGARYFGEGYLALRYGDRAIDFLRDNSQTVALTVAALVLGLGLAYVIWRHRRRPPYNPVPTHGA